MIVVYITFLLLYWHSLASHLPIYRPTITMRLAKSKQFKKVHRKTKHNVTNKMKRMEKVRVVFCYICRQVNKCYEKFIKQGDLLFGSKWTRLFHPINCQFVRCRKQTSHIQHMNEHIDSFFFYI